jgi:hypothetical protein
MIGEFYWHFAFGAGLVLAHLGRSRTYRHSTAAEGQADIARTQVPLQSMTLAHAPVNT